MTPRHRSPRPSPWWRLQLDTAAPDRDPYAGPGVAPFILAAALVCAVALSVVR